MSKKLNKRERIEREVSVYKTIRVFINIGMLLMATVIGNSLISTAEHLALPEEIPTSVICFSLFALYCVITYLYDFMNIVYLAVDKQHNENMEQIKKGEDS